MIHLKNPQEIKVMREGGKKLRKVLNKVLDQVKPGVSKMELEQVAIEEIKLQGGKPSFKMVPGYHWATCLTINDEVVHGIPNEDILKEGDILSVDVGIYYQGFHTDLSTTVRVGKKGKNDATDKFLETGKRALKKAIQKARVGNFVGDLSLTIEKEIKDAGYYPVRTLTGHGVGRKLHEDPAIPCFLTGKKENTPKLKSGMALAIEIIYNLGSEEIVLENDGWTISTRDGKISGLFEETVAVTGSGPLILTG